MHWYRPAFYRPVFYRIYYSSHNPITCLHIKINNRLYIYIYLIVLYYYIKRVFNSMPRITC